MNQQNKKNILSTNNNSEIQQVICYGKFLDTVEKESSDEEILIIRESLVNSFRNESINYMHSLLFDFYSKLNNIEGSRNLFVINSDSVDIYNIENYFSFRFGYISGLTIPYIVNELTEKFILCLSADIEYLKLIKNDLNEIQNELNKAFFNFFLYMVNRIDVFYGPAGISKRIVPIELLKD